LECGGKRYSARRRFFPRPVFLKAVPRFACHRTPKWLAPHSSASDPAAAPQANE